MDKFTSFQDIYNANKGDDVVALNVAADQQNEDSIVEKLQDAQNSKWAVSTIAGDSAATDNSPANVQGSKEVGDPAKTGEIKQKHVFDTTLNDENIIEQLQNEQDARFVIQLTDTTGTDNINTKPFEHTGIIDANTLDSMLRGLRKTYEDHKTFKEKHPKQTDVIEQQKANLDKLWHDMHTKKQPNGQTKIEQGMQDLNNRIAKYGEGHTNTSQLQKSIQKTLAEISNLIKSDS